MKNLNPRRFARGFTLVELLVVIAIIAILAAMLLPVLSRVRVKAQVKMAQVDASKIAAAISSYESDYSRMPASSQAMNASANPTVANDGPGDFTYGTWNLPNIKLAGGGNMAILAVDAQNNKLSYQANNSEVVSILMDMEYYSNNPAMPTPNQGHVRNMKRHSYLNANMVSDTNLAGIGPDLVFRDPWKNPFIITLDMNADGKARDSFYQTTVSQTLGNTTGINGLSLATVGGTQVYEVPNSVAVWSVGPDLTIDIKPNTAATSANKDNILSWKQ